MRSTPSNINLFKPRSSSMASCPAIKKAPDLQPNLDCKLTPYSHLILLQKKMDSATVFFAPVYFVHCKYNTYKIKKIYSKYTDFIPNLYRKYTDFILLQEQKAQNPYLNKENIQEERSDTRKRQDPER